MRKNLKLLSFLCFSCVSILAQETPTSKVLFVNNVQATFNSDGSLFHNPVTGEGGFVVDQTASDEPISTMRRAGLWVAAQDAVTDANIGSFHTSEDSSENGFDPSPGFNKIWSVTKNEILAHIEDFEDNGVIDDPIENIFAWPGSESQNYLDFNSELGQEIPSEYTLAAPYYNGAADQGAYEPELGEFPRIELRGVYDPMQNIPDEMFYFQFTTKASESTADIGTLNMNVRCVAFAYNCENSSIINNTIFVKYSYVIINSNSIAENSLQVGFLNDFLIGNTADDFFGSFPADNTVYAYNGDLIDEGGFESNSPVMAMTILEGPLQDVEPYDFLGEDASLIKSVDGNTEYSGGQLHNILSGNNPDGSVDPNGNFFYSDNPNNPDGNSEVTANNTPGERQTITSIGPLTQNIGAINDILVAYTFYREPNSTPVENVDAFLEGPLAELKDFYYMGMDIEEYCSLSSTVGVRERNVINDLTIFPNPSSNLIHVSTEQSTIQEYRLLDVAGQLVSDNTFSDPTLNFSIDVSSLGNGMYFLELISDDKQVKVEKVNVLR